MLRANKKIRVSVIVGILCVLSIGVAVSAAYLNTNRDTRMAPEKAKSDLKITDSYQKLYETDKVAYYFREDRDIIAIEDKETGYIWKTGIDVPYKEQVSEAKEAVLGEGRKTIEDLQDDYNMTAKQIKQLANSPIEESLNQTHTALANSLITIDYFKGSGESMTNGLASSAAYKEKDGISAIQKVSDLGDEWVLKVTFKDIELGINVYINFGDDGSINYKIPQDEFTGEGVDLLSDIRITPFMGASGGLEAYYDKKDKDWTKMKRKYLTPGYAFVPDGSGSLIRFTNNKSKFSDYNGDMYGSDPASYTYYYNSLDNAVPVEDPVMPVFGISQGDGTQSAFVAYADSGDEYMTISATPSSTEKNQVRYTYAYPKFVYNQEYYQVTNQAGDAYRKTQDESNKFDVDITYKFLYGDGSNGEPAADYTGMAKAYRQHLIDNKTLTVKDSDKDTMPIRIDFLMSDSKKGVMGTEQVVVTNTEGVGKIIDKLTTNGITNINSGIIGWQKGGESLSKPYSTKFSGSIGSKGDFGDLISKYSDKGIDISLSRDFSTINATMINYYGNAAKHFNTQYLSLSKANTLPDNSPVKDFGYALPTKAAKWVTDLYGTVGKFSKSLTIAGISNTLVSSHNSNGSGTTVTEAIKLYQDAIAEVKDSGASINLDGPNKYLWQYTDRYLQSSVGTSQYVYETDSVPFLQMVLNGTMEVYAPYSNFSFYSQNDMLKMIDYNISPSFILTKEPSYLLASTTSADYYSTEFDQYEELIGEIYNTVNDVLSQVINYQWIDRDVAQDGVIVNKYEKDGIIKTVVINYTKDQVSVANTTVEPQSSIVIEGGVN